MKAAIPNCSPSKIISFEVELTRDALQSLCDYWPFMSDDLQAAFLAELGPRERERIVELVPQLRQHLFELRLHEAS